MENWQVALLTLAALVVGVSIPVLLQLRSTLREVQVRVRESSQRIGSFLDDAGVTAARVRRVTDGVEGHEEQIAALFRSAGDLPQTLDRMRSTAHLASAVAAAAVAGFRAFRGAQAGDERAGDAVATGEATPAADQATPAADQDAPAARSVEPSEPSEPSEPTDGARPQDIPHQTITN